MFGRTVSVNPCNNAIFTNLTLDYNSYAGNLSISDVSVNGYVSYVFTQILSKDTIFYFPLQIGTATLPYHSNSVVTNSLAATEYYLHSIGAADADASEYVYNVTITIARSVGSTQLPINKIAVAAAGNCVDGSSESFSFATNQDQTFSVVTQGGQYNIQVSPVLASKVYQINFNGKNSSRVQQMFNVFRTKAVQGNL